MFLVKLIDKTLIIFFIKYRIFFCNFLLAVGFNILLFSFFYFEMGFIENKIIFGFNYDILLNSTTSDKKITYFLMHTLDYIDNLDENPMLVSNDVSWALSLDSYYAIEMLLWNLLKLNEIELVLKSFWDFDSILNYNNFQYQIYKVYSLYNNNESIFNESNVNELNNIYVKKIISFQLQFLELIEIILRKKITSFFIYNIIFFIIMTITILYLNKSTNLIYTLLSFLVFAITCGLLIIFWGSEYIGLCVLLIYGAAIPVLALYIIMLVNVDLIQWLFFIESVKNFSFLKQIKFVFISFFFASLIIAISKNDITSFLTQKNYFLMLIYHHVFYLNISWRYINVIDTSYGLDNILELPLNFYNTDLDKVASSAFKLSINELFALVLLLLVAIIVVISISWPSTIENNMFQYDLHVVNWTIFNILCNHNSYIDNLSFRYGFLLCKMREYSRKKGIPVVEDYLDFRFFVSLHSFTWVHNLGSREYRLFPFLFWPRWKDYSQFNDYYDYHPDEYIANLVDRILREEEIHYPWKPWKKLPWSRLYDL